LPDAKAKYDMTLQEHESKVMRLAGLKQQYDLYASYEQERRQIENNS
jgi:hypothetical protein